MAKQIYYTYEVTVDGETSTWSSQAFDMALADFLARSFYKAGKIEKVANEWVEPSE